MSIREEICALKRKSGKLLKAEVILRWAKKHPDSALYGALEWDDTAAAHQYRLSQVAELVRIHAVDLEGVRTLVSLSVDRVAGGGWRSMQEVVSDKKLSAILLEDALGDLRRFEERYKLLRDLVSGIRKIRKRHEDKQKGGDEQRPQA